MVHFCTRLPLALLLAAFSVFTVSAQKVGLVLSGGGAKGLAHVGVLKQLDRKSVV